jgi:hypothetical protein
MERRAICGVQYGVACRVCTGRAWRLPAHAMQLAYLVVLFLALAGGVGNGAGHLLLSVTQRRYFPGAATAPLCLLVGIALLTRLFGEAKARQERE